MQYKCQVCHKTYRWSGYHQGYTKTRCLTCLNRLRRHRSKSKAVEYKGGQCNMCGYSKCMAALTFHHLDPTTKIANIANLHKKWSIVKAELDKCMLICENCHSETHEDQDKGTQQISLVNDRRFTVKQHLVDHKGGKCQLCAYDENLRSLSFHHRDPNKKKFNISGNHCRDLKTLKEEVDKCDLLCHNCHRELEYVAHEYQSYC